MGVSLQNKFLPSPVLHTGSESRGISRRAVSICVRKKNTPEEMPATGSGTPIKIEDPALTDKDIASSRSDRFSATSSSLAPCQKDSFAVLPASRHFRVVNGARDQSSCLRAAGISPRKELQKEGPSRSIILSRCLMSLPFPAQDVREAAHHTK